MEFNEFTKKIRKELKPLCEETAELLVNEVEKITAARWWGYSVGKMEEHVLLLYIWNRIMRDTVLENGAYRILYLI